MASLLMTVPFSIEGRIGKTYNDIMRNCTNDWVGFADHDIFFANPYWYIMFTLAIDKLLNPGFISCKTNKIGCPLQKAGSKKTDDIKYHRERAEELHKEYWNDFEDVTNSQHVPSGLVFVTPRKAWEKVGGFRENGIIGVDNHYVNKLKVAGYKIYILSGLYVYHYYRGT